MRHLFILITTVALYLPQLAFSQSYPAPLSPYVSDYADVIDSKTEARITGILQDLQATQGVEMRVVTINSVSDYNSTQSVPDFTTGMINTWGIGDATRNDGILFLAAIQDREMFIGLGSGYTPVYDDRMDRVFEYHVKPFFTGERYAQGIETGVLETIKRTKADFVETHEQDSLFKTLLHYFVIAVFGVAAFRLIREIVTKRRIKKAKRLGATTSSNHTPHGDNGGSDNDNDGSSGGGSGGGGGGSGGGGGGGGW